MKLPNRLLWVDLETEGLGEDVQILEVALVVTDNRLNEIGFLNQTVAPKGLHMNEFVVKMHTKNGLLGDLVHGMPIADLDVLCAGYAHSMKAVGGPACGSSVHNDVRWLETAGMPLLRKCFNHRVFDVSTLKLAELIELQLDECEQARGGPGHRALPDIRVSIQHARELLGLE